jgi:predicted SAM-dependent methyltransferase
MGDFLYQAKKHYHSALGVEIAENMAQHTTSNLQIQVFRIPFETIETSARFSCIHMSHIIEHIPNPNEWLDKTKSLLTPDGILVLCVPNMFSLTRISKLFLKRIGLRKGKWKNSLRTPDHLFEPTAEGMRFFIKNNGFSMLKIYSYSRSNMTSEGPFAFLFHQVFKLGSNLRLYARKI